MFFNFGHPSWKCPLSTTFKTSPLISPNVDIWGTPVVTRYMTKSVALVAFGSTRTIMVIVTFGTQRFWNVPGVWVGTFWASHTTFLHLVNFFRKPSDRTLGQFLETLGNSDTTSYPSPSNSHFKLQYLNFRPLGQYCRHLYSSVLPWHCMGSFMSSGLNMGFGDSNTGSEVDTENTGSDVDGKENVCDGDGIENGGGIGPALDKSSSLLRL
ncbi:hypothetical protein Tco_0941921 [Tanacetum coccineum]|uniref:Uncharacterized protein n=1 Tax=Tanacetum coccineum TaxID=301880 RepID=A0ABQ5DS93_9ASTR